MIKSEFVLFKYYNNHKLLGDLHLYLDKFVMINLFGPRAAEI